MKSYLTDEQVYDEIAELREDEDVKLARAEQRYKYKERQKLYNLRHLKKRGAELRISGYNILDFHSKAAALDDFMTDYDVLSEED